MFENSQNQTSLQEKCGKGNFATRKLSGRGTLKLDNNCTIRVGSNIVQAHKIRTVQARKVIAPATSLQTVNMNSLTTINLTNLTSSSSEPIIIQDAEQMDHLLKQATSKTNGSRIKSGDKK